MEKGKGEHVEDNESKRNREIETNKWQQYQREPQRKHGEEDGFCEKYCIENAAPESSKIHERTKKIKKNRERRREFQCDQDP